MAVSWALRSVATTIEALLILLFFGTAAIAEPPKEIAIIGGPKSHGIGEHDFPDGVALLREFLDSAPNLQEVRVITFPNGWPANPVALDCASTLVFYFDGIEAHPLLDPVHRAQVERLVKRGVGLVALHQALTLPVRDKTVDLPHWLGGARYGMFDRTEELVEFTPARHPISNGVSSFALYDEFYPTIHLLPSGTKRISILTGKLHPQYRDGKLLVIDKAETHTVAWAFERKDGGRAFAFTGLHYLASLDNPSLRTLLLNAILWTAKIEIPKTGVVTSTPSDAAQKLITREKATAIGPKKTVEAAVITRVTDDRVIEYPWGHIVWYVSRELRNSDTMTVGEAVIKPGQENPRHFHPNCDEVLHVLKGHILSTLGDQTADLKEGDTVSIPAGTRHSAKNIGADDAVLSMSFSSADREVVGE